MKYRNKKTGTVIKTFGKVSGGDWEPIEEKILGQEHENDDSLDNQEEGEVSDEEVSGEKPKTTRRGKK